MEDELDRAERDFEKIMNEENKRISNFIVRGIKNKNWHTMTILEAYSIEEARRMALTIYEEPLIVMDLTLWMHSDEVVKRNLEEIVMAKQKRKNEEVKLDTLHRFEYSFKMKDDKGVFRTYKTLSCKFVILAKTAEEADECLKREIYTTFIKTIEDLEDYKRYDSPITYPSSKWREGLLFYDVGPVKSVNEL